MDRRRICDGSEELRALKERLHMAKVNKERGEGGKFVLTFSFWGPHADAVFCDMCSHGQERAQQLLEIEALIAPMSNWSAVISLIC